MAIEIREERDADVPAIREVNRLAFRQDEEADLVDALRAHGAVVLSLVATLSDRVVGHVLYSPVTVGGRVTGAGLGPMAVHPDHQRAGIGSKLVEAGNRRLEQDGCPVIVVLGHPAFYPRFGFTPASAHGISCDWEVPDDAFMVLVLDRRLMAGVTGAAKYRPEFSMAPESEGCDGSSR